MTEGFVYFIKEIETGNIKIGFSEKHPQKRLKGFQTGNSNRLILQGYIEGTYQDELELHREFADERIRKENEWFKSSPRLIERITELLKIKVKEDTNLIEELESSQEEDEYEGDVNLFGNPDGYGIRISKETGDRYEGEWMDGERHGYGTNISKGSLERSYEGEWRYDKKEGQGKER